MNPFCHYSYLFQVSDFLGLALSDLGTKDVLHHTLAVAVGQ